MVNLEIIAARLYGPLLFANGLLTVRSSSLRGEVVVLPGPGIEEQRLGSQVCNGCIMGDHRNAGSD